MPEFDYWDLSTSEGLDDDELHRRYDDMLDEVTGDIVIGTLRYSAAYTLKNVDPLAYHVGFSEWIDQELGETITEDDPNAEA